MFGISALSRMNMMKEMFFTWKRIREVFQTHIHYLPCWCLATGRGDTASNPYIRNVFKNVPEGM